jgi:dienelactone hydrolase
VTVSKVVHELHSRGARCAAWLYLPQGPGPHPCVVMAHGVAGTRGGRLNAYAERFAAAGMAVYVFNYRNPEAGDGEYRHLLSARRQLADWHAAVETARHIDSVDAGRVAVWGSSVSAGHVLGVAARDTAVAAVVAQGPHLVGSASGRAHRASSIQHLKMTAAGLRDGVGGLQLCQRAGKVQRIQAPVLYCVADDDPATPVDVVEALAARTPHAQVRHYPVAAFDPGAGDVFARLVSTQLGFLRHALRLGGPDHGLGGGHTATQGGTARSA